MIAKMQKLFFGIRCERLIRINSCTIGNLGCNQRADTGKGCIDCFGNRKWFAGDDLMNPVGRCGERIEFVLLCCRNKVFLARKHLTQRTYRRRDMLDTVDDHAFVIAEDDIGMLAHQLDDQCLVADIAHLIEVLNLHIDDSFHVRLINARDASVGDMLAQHHTECRCCQRTWFVLVRQIQKRKRGTCRDGHAKLAVCSFTGE